MVESPEFIICHYAEIALKGRNRAGFEQRLVANIRTALKRHQKGSYAYVKCVQNRIFIKLTARGSAAAAGLVPVLQSVFGIAALAAAVRVPQNIEALCERVPALLGTQEFSTFRITTRRTDKHFPLNSQRCNELIGARVVEQLGRRVQLKQPDLTCHVDIVFGAAFIYTARRPGPGGLPVGVSGKVAVMLSGGIDSPVAAYLSLKRGARLVVVHFHSLPYTTETSLDKVRELARLLTRYQPRLKLILVPLAPIQQAIVTGCDPRLRVILYRRFMFRITTALARRERALALVTGESLGQVASQTLENLGVIGEATDLPVLRPLIGMDKQEIIDLAAGIGTYPISIQPHQDCCSLFVPAHPETRARLEQVRRAESHLQIQSLVEDARQSATAEFIEGP